MLERVVGESFFPALWSWEWQPARGKARELHGATASGSVLLPPVGTLEIRSCKQRSFYFGPHVGSLGARVRQ